MRSDADRVNNLDAVAEIKARITVGLDDFLRDEMLQVWVIHHLQVIGEAARGMSQPLNNRKPISRRRKHAMPRAAVWVIWPC